MKIGLFAAAISTAAVSSLWASGASAATYQVGPTRAFKTLTAVAPQLVPGDVVELDGGATYPSSFLNQSGTAAKPITVRGMKVGGKRPVLSGGDNTLHIQADHYVVEGLELTAGVVRCYFHHGDDVKMRDMLIHDCPNHGILGADNDSGSLLLELSEIYKCGESDQHHQVYMATDEVVHPGSVFRMQFNYVHDGTGGIGVKSRAERNEIYYNWFEGNVYYDLQPIGSQEADEGQAREDSDVVGNVFVRHNEQAPMLIGGDGTAQSFGRYRIVNNTFVTQQIQWGSPVIRVRDGIESVELHNNVFFSTTSAPIDLFRFDAIWTSAGRSIAGTNNWVQAGALNVPPEWTGTMTGTNPGFQNLDGRDLTPSPTSPLVNKGGPATQFAAHPFPKPLPVPAFLPPAHALMVVPVPRVISGAVDVGAFESGQSSSTAVSSSVSSSTVSSTGASTGATASSSSGTGGSAPATVDENKTYYWPILGVTATLAGFLALLGKKLLVKK